jgi:hypothetical protein
MTSSFRISIARRNGLATLRCAPQCRSTTKTFTVSDGHVRHKVDARLARLKVTSNESYAA